MQEVKKIDLNPQPLPQVDWAWLNAQAEAADREEEAATIRRNIKTCGAYEGDLEAAGFENFMQLNGNQSQLTARRICENFLHQILTAKTGATLLLYGPSSTGKTYMALSVLKAFCTKRKPPLMIQKADGTKEDANVKSWHRGFYTTSEDACKLLTDSSFDGKADRAVQKQTLKEAELLVIDEIGRSLQTQKKERDSLFEILNYRISNRRPSILISNYTETELADFLGAALFHRINSVAVLFDASNMPNMRDPQIQRTLQERRAQHGRPTNPAV